MNPTSKSEWISRPSVRSAHRTLVPLVADSAWSQALGPTHLAWMMQGENFDKLPVATPPDVWFVYRTNPAISFWDTDAVESAMAKFPFTVCFAYTRDETNHVADVLLPDCTDLEGLQLLRIGGTKYVEQFWDYQGFALRAPAVPAQGEAMDFTWIATELARRTGLIEAYNSAINRGAAGVRLSGKTYDFSLAPEKVHDVEAIWDASCRAASAEITDGAESQGLDWFREHGFRVKPFPRLQWYLYPKLIEQGLRFEQPYQEQLFRIGKELGRRLHEQDIHWWDKQLAEYEPLPKWHDLDALWEEALAKHYSVRIADYPFWLITARSMQYSWGGNVGIQIIKEVADNVAGHGRVVMNHAAAARLGIADGDLVEVRSPLNETKGRVMLCEGIRPDTLLDDRPVRSLGDALRQGFPCPQHECAGADAARSHRRHRFERRSGQSQGDAAGGGGMTRWAMVADLERCVGCQTCTAACRHSNATSPAVQWRKVLDIEVGSYPNVSRVFVPVGCQHCADPPCMHVCPTTATRQRADGIVTVDYDICIGCAYCEIACPYQARFLVHEPHYAYGPAMQNEVERADATRVGVAQKCTFCSDRIDFGLENGLTPGIEPRATPACVNSCIADALHFGDIDDPNSNVSRLLHEQKSFRMHAELETDPGFHYVYGKANDAGEESAAAPAVTAIAGEIRSRGVEPELQQHWDWKAASNFICGGIGSGLFVFTAIAGLRHPQVLPLGWLALVIIALGLSILLLKIGRPLRFIYVLRQPQRSWMAREAWIATVFFPLAALALWFGHPALLIVAATLAVCFLLSQAMIMQAAKGIPTWRSPWVVPLIVTTGFRRG